jgi:hypothetical protein
MKGGETQMKTNNEWYKYEFAEVSGYFKMEDGLLMGCPIKEDGSREDAPAAIEILEYVGDQLDQLIEIERDLELRD